MKDIREIKEKASDWKDQLNGIINFNANIEDIIGTGLHQRYDRKNKAYEYHSYAEFRYADILYNRKLKNG